MCRLMVITIYVTALLTGLVLSHQSENNGGILSNNSLEFKTSPTDEMTTLIHTQTHVWHMEPDLHVSGNILFSEYYALRTTDGVSASTIVGSTSSHGNTVAVGQQARLGHLGGFRQISSTHVVVVDHSYHCLRLVDRITLQTPWYAGYCGRSSYSQGTSRARFNNPWSIISDEKRAGMLLVADRNNDAIRRVHTSVGSGLCSVSQFYKSSSLDAPIGLTQDPISGDLYITTYRHTVFKLTYTSRSLTCLAGSTPATFSNGDFSSSRFSYPYEIILIDNGRKLVLADSYNHRLRVLDLITRRSSSICTGVSRYFDGNISTCTLAFPMSLMVLNNTLYVGELGRIRKLQDRCHPREYHITPETGLALVEIPGLTETVTLSLPPGTYPIQLSSPTTNCTSEYHVRDARRIACPSTDIQKTASPDTGVAVVDVPLSGSRTGVLSLTPGSYPLLITSDTFNCTVEYNISDYRGSPCANSEVRQSASADTGVALVDMSWSGLNGRLRFPPGNYQLEIMSEGEPCMVDIGVADHRLRRRLVFQAQYDVQCEVPEGNIAESPLTLTGALYTFSYSEICATDCKQPDNADMELACTNHTLTVVWPSNITYTGDVNRIPAVLDQVLTPRIVAKGLAFVLFLPEITPPFVYPEQEENGGYMKAKLSSYCIGEDVSYVEVSDSCGQHTAPVIPEM